MAVRMIMFLCKSSWHLKYVSGGAAYVYRRFGPKMRLAQSAVIDAISAIHEFRQLPCINPGQRLGKA